MKLKHAQSQLESLRGFRCAALCSLSALSDPPDLSALCFMLSTLCSSFSALKALLSTLCSLLFVSALCAAHLFGPGILRGFRCAARADLNTV
jgi:hypothetical protein